MGAVRTILLTGVAGAAVLGVAAFALRDRGWLQDGPVEDPELDADRASIQAARALLEGSPTGLAALDRLEADHARVTIVDDEVFDVARHQRQRGQYQPWNDEILLRRSATRDTARMALLLVHEGYHRERRWRDVGDVAGAGAVGVGEGMGDGYDPGRWWDVWSAARGSVAGATEDAAAAIRLLEIGAYERQSQVARELGIPDRGYGTDPNTGQAATREQISERLGGSTTYQRLPQRPPEDAPRPNVADAENSFQLEPGGPQHLPWLDAEYVAPTRLRG